MQRATRPSVVSLVIGTQADWSPGDAALQFVETTLPAIQVAFDARRGALGT